MEEFTWDKQHQAAFDKIKECRSKPPAFMPSIQGHPLKLYFSAANDSIGCLLEQNNSKRH